MTRDVSSEFKEDSRASSEKDMAPIGSKGEASGDSSSHRLCHPRISVQGPFPGR